MTAKTGIRRAATAAAAVLVGWSALRRKRESADGDSCGAARDDGQRARGRDAHRPTAIPFAGWKDILWRSYRQMGKDRVLLVAAGVTFYALLALFPALTALVSIYGIFADPQMVVDHVEAMSAFLPAGAMDIIGGQMERIAEQPTGQLNVGFIGGLAITLWSANNGMKALFEATNVAYNEEEKRGFIRLTTTTLLFTLGAIALLILTLSAIVVVPILLGFVGLDGWTNVLLQYARWPVLFLVIIGGIALLYRVGPSRAPAAWRWVLPGSIAAAAIWLVASLLFSWYVANFDSYNETYGSLGAVIAFMVWIWVSAAIIIMGAEFNSETEHQTRVDTTTGGNAPMGMRQAKVADTLGQRMDK
jgi:membrane protein